MRIQTKWLVITELAISDAPFFFELVNDPDWKRFIGDRNVHTISDAEAYLTERIIPSYANNGFGFYKVSLKKNNAPIGITGLVDRETLDHIDIALLFYPLAEEKDMLLKVLKPY